MIAYNYEVEFRLTDETNYTHWLTRVLKSERASLEEINYIFSSDDYLLSLNRQFLQHDTFTDIITFDYSEGDAVRGDIFISIDRVKENALKFKEGMETELKRVMVHGVLHLLGYNDKTKEEKLKMRVLEDEKLKMFHVEQK